MAKKVMLVHEDGTRQLMYTADAKELLRGQQDRGEDGPWKVMTAEAKADLTRVAPKIDPQAHEAFNPPGDKDASSDAKKDD